MSRFAVSKQLRNFHYECYYYCSFLNSAPLWEQAITHHSTYSLLSFSKYILYSDSPFCVVNFMCLCYEQFLFIYAYVIYVYIERLYIVLLLIDFLKFFKCQGNLFFTKLRYYWLGLGLLQTNALQALLCSSISAQFLALPIFHLTSHFQKWLSLWITRCFASCGG